MRARAPRNSTKQTTTSPRRCATHTGTAPPLLARSNMTPLPATRHTIGEGMSVPPAPGEDVSRRPPPAPLPPPVSAAGSPYVPVNPAASPPDTRSVEKRHGGEPPGSPGAAAFPAAFAAADAADTQDTDPPNPGSSPARAAVSSSAAGALPAAAALPRTRCDVPRDLHACGRVGRRDSEHPRRGVHDDGGCAAAARRVADVVHDWEPRTPAAESHATSIHAPHPSRHRRCRAHSHSPICALKTPAPVAQFCCAPSDGRALSAHKECNGHGHRTHHRIAVDRLARAVPIADGARSASVKLDWLAVDLVHAAVRARATPPHGRAPIHCCLARFAPRRSRQRTHICTQHRRNAAQTHHTPIAVTHMHTYAHTHTHTHTHVHSTTHPGAHTQ